MQARDINLENKNLVFQKDFLKARLETYINYVDEFIEQADAMADPSAAIEGLHIITCHLAAVLLLRFEKSRMLNKKLDKEDEALFRQA